MMGKDRLSYPSIVGNERLEMNVVVDGKVGAGVGGGSPSSSSGVGDAGGASDKSL